MKPFPGTTSVDSAPSSSRSEDTTSGRLSRRIKDACRLRLAWVWRRALRRTTFVAIVGSLGKTTTRELLYAVLSEANLVTRTPRSENNDVGIARTLLATRPWHRYCIVEIGIRHPGDMARRARLVHPDVAVLVNVERCHVETLGSEAGVLAEKASVFDFVSHGGVAVLNVAYPKVAALTLPAHLRRVEFEGWRPAIDPGRSSETTLVESSTDEIDDAPREARLACRLISASSVWPETLTVEVEYLDGPGSTHRELHTTALVGEHWANAAVAVAATARVLGATPESIAVGLASVPNWKSRLEPVAIATRGATFVRDDFNGSIDTVRSSLAWLGSARAGRRIVIHGDAWNMDTSAVKTTAPERIGEIARMAAAHADHVISITEHAEAARSGAMSAEGASALRTTPVPDVHAAIAWCRAELREGDVVLCKGRRSQRVGRVFFGLFGEVRCYRSTCELDTPCEECPELGFRVTAEMRAGTAPVLGGSISSAP